MVAWSPGGLRGGGPSATGACYQNGTATARAKTAGSSTTVRSESRARNFKLTHYPAFQGLKLIRTCSPRVSPRLRASASRSIPPLDAIPTRTEQSASRYVRAIADGGSAPHPESVQRQSPGAEFPRDHQGYESLPARVPAYAFPVSEAFSSDSDQYPQSNCPAKPQGLVHCAVPSLSRPPGSSPSLTFSRPRN